jgi:hypothetical protein
MTLILLYIRHHLETLTGGTVTIGTFTVLNPWYIDVITWHSMFILLFNIMVSICTGLAGVYAAYKFKKHLEKQDNEKSN